MLLIPFRFRKPSRVAASCRGGCRTFGKITDENKLPPLRSGAQLVASGYRWGDGFRVGTALRHKTGATRHNERLPGFQGGFCNRLPVMIWQSTLKEE
ncbi:hypothetical protein QO004_005496 [Rhizobium mesoamericanum]|nr:hypothetical protein [Rhizobium mesoamericanum]